MNATRRFVLFHNDNKKYGFKEQFNRSVAEINAVTQIIDERALLMTASGWTNGTKQIPKKGKPQVILSVESACEALSRYGVRVLEIMN